MYSEARKMRLIEDILKVKNEAVLLEIENVLKRSTQQINQSSAHDFVGLWSIEEAEAIEKAIEEGYQKISLTHWQKTVN